MAENVTLDPTTTSGGAVIHTDELSSGAHVQRIKVGYGNPGVYADVSASNPFPITGDVSVGNTVAVSNAGLTELAAAINANELDVNLATATATVTVTGSVDASVGNTVSVAGTVTANAGTGTMSVSDGAVVSALGGTLTVSDGAVVSKLNTVFGNSSLVTSGAVRVNLDSSNVSIGGGTQYSVGTSGVGSVGTGTLMIGVRDDALSTLPEAEGQASALRVDSTGALWVSAAPGDAETTDGATVHSLGVTRQVNVGFVSEPNELSVGANTIGMAGMDSTRAIWVHIKEDSAGIGGGTQYSEGTVIADTTGVGNLLLVKRDDALGGLSEAAGQAVSLRVDANGALWVQHNGAMDVSVGNTVSVSGTVTANAGTGTMAVSDGAVVAALGGTLAVSVGNTVTVTGSVTADLGSNNDIQGQGAHDAAVTGNPVVIGARATNSIEGITQVANADAVRLAADLNGVLVTRPHTTLEENISENASATTTGSIAFSTFGAGGAGVHNYITDVTITNSSSTDSVVQLRDGTSGSVIWTFAAPATGGATHSFSAPLKQATANTALAWDPLTAATTIYISINGFQAQG